MFQSEFLVSISAPLNTNGLIAVLYFINTVDYRWVRMILMLAHPFLVSPQFITLLSKIQYIPYSF